MDFIGLGQFLTGPTSPLTIATGLPPSASQNLQNFTSGGKQLGNSLALQGTYLYRPDVRFTGAYTNTFASFADAGGQDVFHSVGGRAIYNWKQDHNPHAGYTVSIFNARNGDSGVIHNLDIGDDYFTNYTLRLTPTLSLAASSGLSLNTSNSGPRVANNTSVTITKLWETAEVNGGIKKGLTPSFGVSGISDTTSFFASLNWHFTENISATSNADFSFYDTQDVNFKTFYTGLSFQYLITSWLASAISYSFKWIDSGPGANSTDLLQRGIVRSNSVLLSATLRFDVWPNIGLSRSISSSTLVPVLIPPFPPAAQSSP